MTKDNTTLNLSRVNDMTLLDAALAYAEMGFPVFPLWPGEKNPALKDSWGEIATRDPDTIRQWWTDNPQRNIALPMGSAFCGYDASDLDEKDGKHGVASFAALLNGNKGYRAPSQATPSGGRHLLHHHVSGIINFVDKGEQRGIDYRTNGGYIVGAPSVYKGKRYRWDEDRPVPALPDNIVGAFRGYSAEEKTRREGIPIPDPAADVPGIDELRIAEHHRAFLEDGAVDASYDDDQSRALMAACCALFAARYPDDVVWGVLLDSYAAEVAQQHRRGCSWDEWLWKYNVLPAMDYKPPSAAEMFSKADETLPVDNTLQDTIDYLDKRLKGDDVGAMFEPKALAGGAVLLKDSPAAYARVYDELKNKRWQAGDWKTQVIRVLRNSADGEGIPDDYALHMVELILGQRYGDGEHLIKTEDGSYWEYQKTHWVRVADKVVEKEALTIIKGELPGIKKAAKTEGIPAPGSSAVLSATMKILGATVTKAGDPLHLHEPQSAVVNCLNGSLWLTGDEPDLLPHNPADGLTFCTGIEYDAGACSPVFNAAISDVLQVKNSDGTIDTEETAERVRHVEEQMGYAMQPARFLKVWFLWYGAGDNGKGRLVEMLTILLGNDSILAQRISTDGEENPARVAALLGKLLWVDDDLDANTLLPDGLLKKVSEQKPLSGAFKFKDEITFMCVVVVLMLANNWPRSRDMSLGMRTRAQIVTFERSFKKPNECKADDPDRQRPEIWATVYRDEMTGVLNKLVSGFYRLKRRGAFDEPATCQIAKQEWLKESNPVARFVDECGKPDSGEAWQGLAAVFMVYADWAESQNIPRERQATRKTLKRHLLALGLDIRRAPGGVESVAVFGKAFQFDCVDCVDSKKGKPWD